MDHSISSVSLQII